MAAFMVSSWDSNSLLRRRQPSVRPQRRMRSGTSMVSDMCPSRDQLEQLMYTRALSLRASSSHVRHAEDTEGTDSSFVLNTEGFIGVADTGTAERELMHSEPFSRRVHFENRSLLDDIIWNIFFNGQESLAYKMSSFLEQALALVTFPQLASACVLRLEDHHVHAAWIGSAGFILVRDGSVVFRSRESAVEELENSYKLECQDVDSGRSDGGTVGRGGLATRQRAAIKVRQVMLNAEEGDLLVVASDGLWNNVSEEQLIALLRPTPPVEVSFFMPKDDPQTLSTRLAYLGASYAELPHGDHYLSHPSNHAHFVPGGTHEDVTVVVGCIGRP